MDGAELVASGAVYLDIRFSVVLRLSLVKETHRVQQHHNGSKHSLLVLYVDSSSTWVYKELQCGGCFFSNRPHTIVVFHNSLLLVSLLHVPFFLGRYICLVYPSSLCPVHGGRWSQSEKPLHYLGSWFASCASCSSPSHTHSGLLLVSTGLHAKAQIYRVVLTEP